MDCRLNRFFMYLGAAVTSVIGAAAVRAVDGGGVLDLDLPQLVAAADLRLDGPVSRSEAGLPIGNGRMGTLVWTTPTAVHMQINRVDVFANNKDSASFPERHTDYCGACAFVDIDAGEDDAGGDVFTADMKQSLTCNDGLASLEGAGVRVRALAAATNDLIALEVTDERATPAAIRVRLRMIRPPLVKHFAHAATSKLDTRGEQIVLTQAFEEGDYYCGSAVAVSVTGRAAKVEETSGEERTLVVEPGAGPVVVRVSSAASFIPTTKIADAAVALVDPLALRSPAAKSFDELLAANAAWWSNFWGRGFIQLHSDDGVADTIQQHYYYYLYLMASTSRGKYPTKFNGMLWITGGDQRQWGGQFWGANQSCIYNGLLPTNRWELLDPMFNMYTSMVDSCAIAAKQQWGSQGIFIPETHAFDGLARLPDDIAAEMRDLYLVRKPMTAASEKFLKFSKMRQPHSSRWNWWESGSMQGGVWEPVERPEAPFGAVTHIFSRGAKIAYMYWQRYEFTRDKLWLQTRAYPMLKGVAEFYRNFPNTARGGDGKWHIHHVNSNESVRDVSDADEEIAAMRGVFPALIRASNILGVDADLRPKWQEFLDNLAPLPRSDDPAVAAWRQRRGGRGGQRGGRDDDGAPYWVRGVPPVRSGGLGRPDGNTMPQWFFDLCTLENPDAATRALAEATLGDGRGGGVLSKMGVTNAMMGRADNIREFLPQQISSPDRAAVMENRMDQREGPQTTSAQRLGRVADALHTALVQSVGSGPAANAVIRLFPAWPKEWDASFTLLCRGAFLVTSSIRDGNVQFVVVDSNLGETCRVRNPWGDARVTLVRRNGKTEDLAGSLLTFATAAGERITLIPAGTTIDEIKAAVKRKPAS